jgi:hypothetical protein
MFDNGIVDMHMPTIEKIAKQHDAMSPFFCKAVLLLTAMLERGELKGKTPDDLFIGLSGTKQ